MSVKTLLNRIRKTTGSESFITSRLGMISGYVSTGIYALNRIISGDIYNGIPNGRVIIFAGESQSGKSWIAANTLANALNDGYDIAFYLDSEGGGLRSFFEGCGCDISKIEHVPIESVEDATVKLLSIFNELKEERLKYQESIAPLTAKLEDLKIKAAKNPKKAADLAEDIAAVEAEIAENKPIRAILVMDSLGALVANKVYKDAAKGDQKADMGSRARLVNNMMKGCTMPALITDTPIIVVNHTYADPSNMYPGKIQNQSGGQGLQLMSSITIQCNKHPEKADVKDETDTYYSGSYLKFFNTKNRIIKPYYETSIFIDFSKGVRKYEGLVEPAIKYGFIRDNEVKNGYYTIPSWKEDELIKKDNIYSPDYYEAWETFIAAFNEKSKQEMQYSNAQALAEANKLIDAEEEKTEKMIEENPEKAIEMLGIKVDDKEE